MRRVPEFAASASVLGGAALLAAVVASCAADFDPQNKITSVRILASRADKPYAHPGDSVALEVLAVDGRADRRRPMQIFWFPFVCINPKSDLYYACFAGAPVASVDGGTLGDGGAGPEAGDGIGASGGGS